MNAPIEARIPFAAEQDGQHHDQDPFARSETLTGAQGRWVCRTCRNPIAQRSALFSLGQTPGLYSNPHGSVFEIITVREACGLVGVGPRTLEHTWFAGYAWRVVCCSNCLTHLGWQFTTTQDGARPCFFGLILAELVEEND